jgi:hypothetical protein
MNGKKWLTIVATIAIVFGPLGLCGILKHLFDPELDKWIAAGQLEFLGIGSSLLLLYLFWNRLVPRSQHPTGTTQDPLPSLSNGEKTTEKEQPRQALSTRRGGGTPPPTGGARLFIDISITGDRFTFTSRDGRQLGTQTENGAFTYFLDDHSNQLTRASASPNSPRRPAETACWTSPPSSVSRPAITRNSKATGHTPSGVSGPVRASFWHPDVCTCIAQSD